VVGKLAEGYVTAVAVPRVRCPPAENSFGTIGAGGSQTADLQRGAFQASGVDADSLYQDRASGKKDADFPNRS
jgi:hypothetical protein